MMRRALTYAPLTAALLRAQYALAMNAAARAEGGKWPLVAAGPNADEIVALLTGRRRSS